MKSLIILKISLTIFYSFFLHLGFAQVYIDQGTGPQHQATTVSVYGPAILRVNTFLIHQGFQSVAKKYFSG